MPTKSARLHDEPAQIAALPIRTRGDGSIEILLITSRETRRWVIPKGWPMKSLKDRKAAAQEALEEAGLIGKVSKEPIGTYTYWKRRTDSFSLCTVGVFLLEVEGQAKTWREKDQRKLEWFSPEDAAERVDEPGLCHLILQLGRQRPAAGSLPPMQTMRPARLV